jgi:hypothetical protein
VLARQSQRSQRELGEAFRNAPTVGSAFQLPDFLCFNDVPGFALETRLQFVGQQSAREKPVQGLATALRAAYSDPTRPMPQFDSGPSKKSLFNVSFRTTQGCQPFAQGFRFFL